MAADVLDPPPVVRARGLALYGPRGPVFGPVDLDVPAGALVLFAGPAGSGRTSLLLTLAGRMSGTRGELEVAGLSLARQRRAIQHTVTLATIRGVNDLDGSLTVEEHVLERLALASPWWRLLLPSGADVAPVLATVHDREHADLDPSMLVRDLAPYDRFRLGIALAAVARPRQLPRVLVVDDVDALRDPAAVDAAWRLLSALTSPSFLRPDGLVVLASCTAADTVPDQIRMDDRVQVVGMRRSEELAR